ncbi:hypothetical protein J1N35_011316 [Gossypium stocksii]|uniref:Uncharacterized protein n=1 Tax=Gossypium stocksii TaxID=47602 RepID=A0A9D4AD36_9ROSI|nr:hypothetical protein J1N35_011316 [Gossypium stocksii]
MTSGVVLFVESAPQARKVSMNTFKNEKDELLSKGEKAKERFTEKKYADFFEKEQTDDVEMTLELIKKKKFKF